MNRVQGKGLTVTELLPIPGHVPLSQVPRSPEASDAVVWLEEGWGELPPTNFAAGGI